MITPKPENMIRVTLTLDPVDVDLLDRLARLEGSNRSEEMRGVLAQLRPVLETTVRAFESALAQREKLDQATAQASISELEQLMPEIERMQSAYLGTMARIEGLAASDPRRSNHGGHTPTDSPPLTNEIKGSED